MSKTLLYIATGLVVLLFGWLIWGWLADEVETFTEPLTVIQEGDVVPDSLYWEAGAFHTDSKLEVVEPVSTPEAPQQSMTVEHQRDLGGK